MAKKSAKSKGYRKTVAKKPYLTKRDITILCVILAVLAVGAFLLFSYDDGALKVKDGRLVETTDNWLIVNGATSRGGRRYFKLGEAGELEGFTRKAEPLVSDDNLYTLRYTPEAEDSPVQSIAMGTNAARADRAAQYYRGLVESLNPGEVATAQAGDTAYTYFIYQTSYHVDDEADAAEAPETAGAETAETEEAPNRFEQAIHAYVDAPHDASISVTVATNARSEADFLTDEQLMDYVAQAIGTLKVEEK